MECPLQRSRYMHPAALGRRILINGFLIAAMLTPVAELRADPIISVVPKQLVATVSDPLRLEVLIGATAPTMSDDVFGLFAYQFGVMFNPRVLSATSVSEGSFLSTAGATSFIPGIIDNAAGLITFNANSLIGPGAGASGSGSLLSVEFLALAQGISTVSTIFDPANGDALLNSLGVEISPFTTVAGEVTVIPGVVPEPGTLLLMGAALTTCALRRRFRRKPPAD